MKKIITIIAFLSISLGAHAQEQFNPLADKEITLEIMRSIVLLLGLYLISAFILTLFRLFLTDRLKRALLEKGVDETVITALLPKNKDEKSGTIKWFTILTAIAVGLTVSSFYQPMGMHSVIIMTASIALGFLAHYFIMKWLNN
jgi:hypothetical protein